MIRISLLLILFATISACSSPEQEELKHKIDAAEVRIEKLRTHLDEGSLRNSKVLKEYAKQVRKIRPEMNTVIDALEEEGTSKGQQFRYLEQRLAELKRVEEQYGDPARLIPEANGLLIASTDRLFSNVLQDPINVLADLSDGRLPRIGVLTKEEEAAFNDVKQFGDASQLVGNPAYGKWVDQGGSSIWQFVGAYAVMNALMSSSPARYNDWNRYRPYSRHQDDRESYAYSGGYGYGGRIGRGGGYDDYDRYRSSYKKTPGVGAGEKSYAGTRKNSSYGKSGGVSYRGQQRPVRSSSYSAGSGAKKSSGYSGSLRNGSSYSRGTFGGK